MHYKVFDGFPYFFSSFFFISQFYLQQNIHRLKWIDFPCFLCHCRLLIVVTIEFSIEFSIEFFLTTILKDAQKSFILSVFLYVTTTVAFSCHWHCFNIEECKARAHGREQFSNWKPLFIVSVFIPKSQAAFHSKNLKLLRTKFHLWPSITFTVHTNNVFEKKNCNWFWDRVGINRSRQIHLSIPKMDDTHYTELWKSQEAIFNLFKQFKLVSYLFRGKKVCSW